MTRRISCVATQILTGNAHEQESSTLHAYLDLKGAWYLVNFYEWVKVARNDSKMEVWLVAEMFHTSSSHPVSTKSR